MKTILVPGFWLTAHSWDPVLPTLVDAGLGPVPLTMPGVGASGDASAEIGIDQWIDAIVEQIDAVADEEVFLVGHSGGGNAVWGATDRRPDRIARTLFVDTVPPPPGGAVDGLEPTDGILPFPGWDHFPESDVFDLDAETRRRTARETSSIPQGVASEAIVLEDERRFDVPVTLLMGSFDEQEFEAASAEWGPYGEEYRAIHDREVVRLDTGHWPQFSAPERLAARIVEAILR